MSVLNALIAGSALSGACVNKGDHEHGSVGLRRNLGLFLGSKNFAGITGTSGSDARLMVDNGDFRLLVEEVERLTIEKGEAGRFGDEDVDDLLKVNWDSMFVYDELVERYDGEYGICGKKADRFLFN